MSYGLTREERNQKAFNNVIVIEKIINLEIEEFKYFEKNLNKVFDFIKENKDLMYFDEDGTSHVLLVTVKDLNYGILTQSIGTKFIRYSVIISKEGLFEWPRMV